MVENNQLKYQRGFSYFTTAIIKLYITTGTLLRREIRSPSYLVFSNFTTYLGKVFETALSDYIWLAECGTIYKSYFQERRKQCYVLCKSMCSEKFLKNSIKLLASSFLVML